jgi:nicotinic acid phosphoribosyltransferase
MATLWLLLALSFTLLVPAAAPAFEQPSLSIAAGNVTGAAYVAAAAVAKIFNRRSSEYGIRLATPSERGRVTADLVTAVRARLDIEGFGHVKIVVSGGLTPDRIRYFRESGAPVDSFAVGSYISGATPIDFTGDIKEIDGRPIAKRGRIPGITYSPRLQPVDLSQYREIVDVLSG